MDELTAYEILGVPETASAGEITAAYERRRRDFHPDLNEGDKFLVQVLDDEYAKVGDEARRHAYDQDLALKRAARAKEEAERAAAPPDDATDTPSSPPAPLRRTPRAPSPPVRPRRARGSSNAGHRATLPDSTPWPAPEPYRYEASNQPGKHHDAEEIFNLIGAGLMVFAWWFIFSEGFEGFKLWWNPVAWVPLVWFSVAVWLDPS